MSEEPADLAPLAPLAALGALDGEDRASFEASLETPACRAELEAFESAAARIPLALDRVPPPAHLRKRLLAAIDARTAPRSGSL